MFRTKYLVCAIGALILLDSLTGCHPEFNQVDHSDNQIIAFAVAVTEIAWKKEFPKVDIGLLEIEHPLNVMYVDNMPSDEEGNPYRGLYYPDQGVILVQHMEEKDWNSCVELRYVLTHELMHYLSDILQVDDWAANDAHLVPNVFLQWAFETETKMNETTEFHSYISTSNWCADKWGFPPEETDGN